MNARQLPQNARQLPPGQLLGAAFRNQQARLQRQQQPQFPRHQVGNGRQPQPPLRPNPENVMTTFLGMPESRGAVLGLAREIRRVDHDFKFGALSMATFGIYPLVKAIKGALNARAANMSVGEGIRAALFK